MNIFLLKDHFKDENRLFSYCYTDPELNNVEHAHEFDELVIVDKGCGVQIFNGELFFIQEGDVFLVRQNDRHFYDELGTLKLMNLHINTKYQYHYLKAIDELLERLHVNKVSDFIWLMPKDKEYCISLIRSIAKLNKKDNHSFSLQSESLLIQLINTILMSDDAIQKNSTQYKIRNVLVYLQENYSEDIDWHFLEEKFFLTNKTMTRKIKELTNMSPVNYLNRLRVLSARQKLRHSDDSITDISGGCGFNNSDYFSRCYKKYFGISPSEERKNAGWF